VLDVYEKPRNVFVAEFLGLSNIWPIQPVGSGMVETPLGKLQIEAPIGAERMAMIRPEKIWIYNDREMPEDKPNIFRGVVNEAIYMGASTQYRVEVTGGQMVLALDTNNAAAERSWRPGEAVAVELKPANIMLIEG
jgi:spermidine/putrescine transport system ATP-binding protein